MLHVVTPYGRNGPSSRVRVYEWLERTPVARTVSGYASLSNSSPATLGRHPFGVISAERKLRKMASSRPGRLLLHREASPLSRGGLERRLLSSAEFAVYDFDDALQWDWGEGALFRRLAPKAPKALAAARGADRVIAGNPVLAEWASQHNDDVVIIPSCVSPRSYVAKSDYETGEPPRLVWMGSVDNEAYLGNIGRALLEVHRRTGARLTVISRTEPSLGGLETIIDRLPWSEPLQYSNLADFDIGIAPVPDTPYTRGKCGYKLLQYAAAGLPIVASPIGVNERILAELDMPGPLRVDDWAEAIFDVLSRSPAERARLGRRAREVVERQYSYDAWLPTWEHAVGITTDRPVAPEHTL